MRTAIYPGSFDPVTFGHLDVIARAAEMFDRLVVGVAVSEAKNPLFSVDERAELIRGALGTDSRIEVHCFNGLLVEFAASQGSSIIIRGLRAVSDFEFEFQLALMNRRLAPKVETVFLTPKEDFTFLSSRIVKEVARMGGDVSPFVPCNVAAQLGERFKDAP